jgi:hypothetical protein
VLVFLYTTTPIEKRMPLFLEKYHADYQPAPNLSEGLLK